MEEALRCDPVAPLLQQDSERGTAFLQPPPPQPALATPIHEYLVQIIWWPQ
nr:hypothetical protein [Burkholderia glumae]